MAHFTRVNGTWVDGVPMDTTWLPGFDQRQFDAVNGVDGGTYGPTADITIGGSGLFFSGPVVVFGASGNLNGNVHLSPGIWPNLGATHSARTRKIVQSLFHARGSVFPEPTDLSVIPTLPPLLQANTKQFGAQFVCTDLIDLHLETTYTPALSMELRVVDGSTLSRVEFRFRVATPRAQAPAVMPRFRVLRRSANDGSTAYLQSTAAGADANGWASPPLPTSGAAWYAGGEAQGFVYTCDQHNAVDRSQYEYFVEIIEESGQTDGPLAIERDLDVAAADEGIAIDSFNTAGFVIDGVECKFFRTRILVVDAYTPLLKNLAGIYTSPSASGSLVRDPSYAANPLSIVRAAGGTKFAGAYFQLRNRGAVLLDSTKLDIRAEPYDRFIAFGNIYHSAVTTFTGIADLRWQ